MYYIICNLHFNKVSSKGSLLYLLNIHIKKSNFRLYFGFYVSKKEEKERKEKGRR